MKLSVPILQLLQVAAMLMGDERAEKAVVRKLYRMLVRP
jgi:hypothetical protein